jgi:PBP1b-binding outer membrane lipoprotein LpoB
MNTKSLKRYTTLAIVSLFVMGCSNGSSKSESDQSPSTAAVIEQTQVSTVGDSQLAAVENDLASLDADLEVIDQAIADLDSVAP